MADFRTQADGIKSKNATNEAARKERLFVNFANSVKTFPTAISDDALFAVARRTVPKPPKKNARPKKEDPDMDDVPTKRKDVKESPFMPKPPLRIMEYGSTGTGKTHWLLNTILLSPDNPFDFVIWIAPEFSLQQKSLQDAKKKLKKRMYLLPGSTTLGLEGDGVDKLEQLIRGAHKRKLQTLVVFDDVMSSKSQLMTDLFTSGRHRGVSVAVLAQRIFTGAMGDRTRRLNTEWNVLFWMGGTGEVANLARSLDSENWREVTAAYKEAVMGKPLGSYLLIDNLSARSPDRLTRMLRYRESSLTKVFPELVDT